MSVVTAGQLASHPSAARPPDHVTAFKLALEQALFEPSHLVQRAVGHLQPVVAILENAPPKAVRKAVQLVQKARRQDWRQELMCLSVLFKLTHKPAYLLQILEIATKRPLSFVERYQVLWYVEASLFRYAETFKPPLNFDIRQRRLRRYYDALVDDLAQAVSVPDGAGEPLPDRVVLLTSQFIGAGHAPTRVALNFARSLRKDFGKDVVIFNCALLPRTVELPLIGLPPANFNGQLGSRCTLEYDGDTYPLHQITDASMTEAVFAKVVDTVAELRPEQVISFGGTNPAADLLCAHMPVTTFPLATDLPLHRARRFAYHRPLNDQEGALLGEVGHDPAGARVYQTVHELPDKHESYRRGDFGLPDDAFVGIVVSNRLAEEVSREFWKVLVKCLERLPTLYLLFAGADRIEPLARSISPLVAERCRFPGMIGDLRALHEIVDLYINPQRRGGGSSAAYALADGLPVITLDKGDVAGVVGDLPTLATLGDYPDAIAALAGDRAAWQRRSDQARRHFADMPAFKEVVGTVIGRSAEFNET